MLLPAGELGEIVVRGHALFKGYLGNPEATAAAVVDGWFRTGDLGTKDADDIVTIVDRKKDMIVRNGYNVYPSEVEDVMMRHPAVAFAAVFGLPDEARGQEVHAAVVLLDGHEATPEELVAFTQERIAAYKFPRVVHLVDALPLGGSGKVLKRELVAQFAHGTRRGLTQTGGPAPRGGPGLRCVRGSGGRDAVALERHRLARVGHDVPVGGVRGVDLRRPRSPGRPGRRGDADALERRVAVLGEAQRHDAVAGQGARPRARRARSRASGRRRPWPAPARTGSPTDIPNTVFPLNGGAAVVLVVDLPEQRRPTRRPG